MVTNPTQLSFSAVTSSRAPRIALFCAETLRPAACCVVDALEIRGYTTQLWTGRNAAAALTRSRRRTDADLRVLLAPEAIDGEVRAKLLRRLDPNRSGDVLLLAFERPCDTVAAVERATGRVPPRVLRPRPSRAVLAHPTLIESRLELRRWLSPGLAGTASLAAVVTAFVLGSPTGNGVRGAPERSAVAAPAVMRISDGPTLAATHQPSGFGHGSDAVFDAELDEAFDAVFDDELERYGDEIIIFDDEVVAAQAIASVHDDAATDAPYTATEATPPRPDLARAAFEGPAERSPPAATLAADTAWAPVTEPLDEAPVPPRSGAGRVSSGAIKLADPFAM